MKLPRKPASLPGMKSRPVSAAKLEHVPRAHRSPPKDPLDMSPPLCVTYNVSQPPPTLSRQPMSKAPQLKQSSDMQTKDPKAPKIIVPKSPVVRDVGSVTSPTAPTLSPVTAMLAELKPTRPLSPFAPDLQVGPVTVCDPYSPMILRQTHAEDNAGCQNPSTVATDAVSSPPSARLPRKSQAKPVSVVELRVNTAAPTREGFCLSPPGVTSRTTSTPTMSARPSTRPKSGNSVARRSPQAPKITQWPVTALPVPLSSEFILGGILSSPQATSRPSKPDHVRIVHEKPLASPTISASHHVHSMDVLGVKVAFERELSVSKLTHSFLTTESSVPITSPATLLSRRRTPSTS
jgi:hypothetical protein